MWHPTIQEMLISIVPGWCAFVFDEYLYNNTLEAKGNNCARNDESTVLGTVSQASNAIIHPLPYSLPKNIRILNLS